MAFIYAVMGGSLCVFAPAFLWEWACVPCHVFPLGKIIHLIGGDPDAADENRTMQSADLATLRALHKQKMDHLGILQTPIIGILIVLYIFDMPLIGISLKKEAVRQHATPCEHFSWVLI